MDKTNLKFHNSLITIKHSNCQIETIRWKNQWKSHKRNDISEKVRKKNEISEKNQKKTRDKWKSQRKKWYINVNRMK